MNQTLLETRGTDCRKYLLRAGFACVALICLEEPARAQAIIGEVRTVAGVPIEGVFVRATRSFPSQRVTTTTDVTGVFVLGEGLNGTYTVEAIEATYTFTPATTNVTVSGSTVRVDFISPSAVPVATTSSATDVSATSATLRGSVNPNGGATTTYFEYGLTASYGSVSGSVNVGNGTNSVPVSISVGNLLNGTNYHFRMVANNSHGTRTSSDNNFTTLLPGIPSVTTAEPTDGGATTMRLNASAVPNGANVTGWFEWGATTNYGNVTASQALGSGTTATNFSQVLTGLIAGTTYHHRAVAATSFATNYGTDVLFGAVFANVNVGLPGVDRSSVAWGDYDNDGRLDILVTGQSGGAPISQIWRNTGNGFSNINANLPNVYDGSVAWGDYDNDGRLDILLTGYSGGSIAQVWRNTGSGFVNINAGLPGVQNGAAAWGDYDNDGRLDILLTGLAAQRISQVWRNMGSGFVNINAGLPGVDHSSVAWGDYDNNGRLDYLLTGATVSAGYSLQLGQNTGGSFVNLNLSPLAVDGSVAWGDYDNDGRLDILVTGASPGNAVSKVLHSTTNIGFVDIQAGLPGVRNSSAAWGDYDNDGRLDILLAGLDPLYGRRITQVWRNTGNGFVNINADLPGVENGSVAWGDYDNDGRLDILLTGMTNGLNAGSICQVWRNNLPTTDSVPFAPSGLNVTVSNSMAVLSWNAVTDTETPAAGLTYNLRIGTTSGGSDVLSPMSGADGFRRLPQLGSAQLGLTALFNYTLGTPYYWSVQAVDSSFAGSPFSAEGTFKILQVAQPPPVVAPVTTTNLVYGDLNGDGVIDDSELKNLLAPYWAKSPWLQMTNVAGLGGMNVTFALTNSIAGAFGVEYTTNLVDWSFLGPATPRYLFTDANAPAQPQRYYRLVWPLNTNSIPPQPAGLISWWRAENDAADSVGPHHGTLQNGAAFAPGKVGQAFTLNGADQYVLIGDPVPPALQIQNEITLSAWIYVTAYPVGDTLGSLGLIVGSQYDGQYAGATIFLDGRTSPDGQPSPPGHIHFQIGDGSWHTANANAQTPLNQWVHIAATRKANENARIYYNGVLQPSTSVPWSGTISYAGAWFAIGQQKDLYRPFNGQIDEVRIYDRALTQEEVAALVTGQ